MDGRPDLIVGSLHVRVILGNVVAGGAEESLVVLGAELVPTGTVDDAAHVSLLRRGWLAAKPGEQRAAEA
jgi:hypothetical protein